MRFAHGTSTVARNTLAGALTLAVTASMLALGASGALAAAPDGRTLLSTQTIGYTGTAFSGTVPTDSCAVTITALGGGGGLVRNTTLPAGIPVMNTMAGSGAQITASYSVRPGMPVAGEVGGGGNFGPFSAQGLFPRPLGGTPDGGGAGLATNQNHYGGAGGGSTTVLIGGTELIVAGGGGGVGGGHSQLPIGGNAGLPVAAGVTAGSDGGNGRDAVGVPGHMAGGGKGGSVSGPGAGGLFTAPPAEIPQADQDVVGGFAGDARRGGDGGNDPSLDTGGGGGGGFFGGGGGASTVSNGTGLLSADGVSGGGGGGGASYVSADAPSGLGSVSGLSSVAGPKAPRLQPTPNGALQLQWYSCGILTDSGASRGMQGAEQRWSPSPSDEATGVAIDAATLELLDGNGDPISTLVVAGGRYTVAGDEIVFTPDADFTGRPTPAPYRVLDADGNRAAGDYAPLVVGLVDEQKQVMERGSTVPFALVDAVTGLDPASVALLDADEKPVSGLAVAGEGVWSIDQSTGVITFVPETGFAGNPTAVRWTGELGDGTPVIGVLLVEYTDPVAPPAVVVPPTGAPGPGGPVAPDAAQQRSGPLPTTGLSAAQALWTALLTLGAGAALLATRRRRGRSASAS